MSTKLELATAGLIAIANRQLEVLNANTFAHDVPCASHGATADQVMVFLGGRSR